MTLHIHTAQYPNWYTSLLGQKVEAAPELEGTDYYTLLPKHFIDPLTGRKINTQGRVWKRDCEVIKCDTVLKEVSI